MKAAPLALLAVSALLSGCAGGGAGESGAGDGAPGSPADGQAAAGAGDGGGSAPPAIQWASPEAATIRPGVQMVSETAQCTSNFVFRSPDNQSIFLGFAAHCVDEG